MVGVGKTTVGQKEELKKNETLLQTNCSSNVKIVSTTPGRQSVVKTERLYQKKSSKKRGSCSYVQDSRQKRCRERLYVSCLSLRSEDPTSTQVLYSQSRHICLPRPSETPTTELLLSYPKNLSSVV